MTEIPRRKSIRVPGFDYSQPGAYFITIVAQNRKNLFGNIVDTNLEYNPIGRIVDNSWSWLFEHFEYIDMDEYCVMPNHFHGIIWINDSSRGGSRTTPTSDVKLIKPLGRLIGVFKTVSTKSINLLNGTPGHQIWQRNYYERIIRNGQELDAIRAYIQSNPLNWTEDSKNKK